MTALNVPSEVLEPELYHREYLKKGSRLDGRGPKDRRQIAATHGGLDGCTASALVTMGKTIVATKITCVPQPIAPSISIHVSRAAVSDVAGAVYLDKVLTQTIELLTSRILPLGQLEIVRPAPGNVFQSAVKLWAWGVNVKTCVLSDDGGLDVAAILSFQEALRDLTLPCFDLDEEARLVENGQTKKLEILCVSALRFAVLKEEGKLFYDPTRDEEGVCDGCCTVVMSREAKPKLMKLTTTGTFVLNPDIIAEVVAACE